jgi:hypothetical protein
MTDLQRLIDGFDAGEFVRPSADVCGFVDVVRAAAHACDVPDIPLNENSRALAARLRRVDHIVFLIADGLGINFIDRLPRDAWLRRHTQRAIQAPYPSTTTAAITSFATAAHPAQHGIIGWWTYLPTIEAPVTVFSGCRVQDGLPISQLGASVRDLSPLDPILPRMQREVTVVQPAAIIDTDFSRYLAGGCHCIGYHSHANAVDAIVDRIRDADGPTFTYWYTPTPDSEAHDLGARDPAVLDAIEELDASLASLDQELARLPRPYRIIGTADHGHLDVGGAGHLEVTQDDPLLEYLHCPPSGDVRTLFWHVRPDAAGAFLRAFCDRFEERFLLIDTDELDALRLLGPEPLSDETRRRAGDFTSIAIGAEVLRYTGAPGRDRYLAQRSHHSGLSSAEMIVPLILAGRPEPAGE